MDKIVILTSYIIIQKTNIKRRTIKNELHK